MKKTLLLCSMLGFAVSAVQGQVINTFPYLEDFEGEPQAPSTGCGAAYTMQTPGWLNETTDDIDWLADAGGTTSNPTGPTVDHNPGTGAGRYMYTETSCNGTGYPNMEAILYSPYMDFTGLATPNMSFWYHMYGQTMGDLFVEVTVGTTGAWIPAAGPITDDVDLWQIQFVDLTPYAGVDSVRVRFRSVSGTNFYSDMAIDDVLVFDGPVCVPPSGIAVNNIGGTTADISWVSGGTNFVYDVVPSGGTPSFATATSATSTSVTASGLMANTTYDVYVANACSANPGDTSAFAGPITFATACATFVAPYLESFDVINTAPNCWTEVVSGAEIWRYNTSAFYGAGVAGDHTGNGGQYAWIDGSTPNGTGMNELISPIVDVSGLTNPALRFYLFSNNIDDTGNNTFTITLTDFGNANTTTTLLVSQQNFGPAWEEFIFDLSLFTGPVQVSFGVETNSTGSAFYNDMLIDDVEFYDGPSCFPAAGLAINNITFEGGDLSWLSSAPEAEIEVVPTGNAPTGNGNVVVGTATTLTGLMSNTSYDVYVSAICAPGDTSPTVGPLTFLTDCSPTLQGDDATTALPLTGLNINVSGTTGTCYTDQFGQASADVWYALTIDDCATSVDIDLCASGFDTYMHILDAGQNLLAFNDDGCGAQSQLTGVPVSGGNVIYIVVEGFGTNTGNYTLNVVQNAAPVVADIAYSATAYCQNVTNPIPSINGTVGGTFNESTGNLMLDANTGEIMLANSPAGSYNVVYVVGAGTCQDSTIRNIVIDPSDDASHSYAMGNNYCIDDADPSAMITGMQGGMFSGSNNLVIDPATGMIDIDASGEGSFDVMYMTMGACPAVDTTPIMISDAGFDYGVTTFCDDDAVTPMPTMNGFMGGTFSAGAGLVIDPMMGSIDILASTAGTYTVSYDVNGCVETQDIIIDARDDASFSYAQTTYCQNGTDPIPTITGTGNGAFSSTTNSPIDIGTGKFNLANAAIGSHIITYGTGGNCPDFMSVTLMVEAADDATFAYDSTSYCLDSVSGTANATITGLTGGAFSSNGITVNATTGAIDIPSVSAGTYDVTYTTAGNCPNTSTVSVTFVDCTAVGVYETAVAENAYNVFPNPNNGLFFINNLGEGHEAHIQLVDALGRVITQETAYLAEGQNYEMNTNNLPSGVYMLRIMEGDKITTYQVQIAQQ